MIFKSILKYPVKPYLNLFDLNLAHRFYNELINQPNNILHKTKAQNHDTCKNNVHNTTNIVTHKIEYATDFVFMGEQFNLKKNNNNKKST